MAMKDALGRAGENRATRHLEQCGYRVIARNWRCSEGEIDIVAVRGDELVVVEVKTRTSDLYGDPLEAVDGRKRRRLWRLAMAWLATHPDEAQGMRLRIDAIGLVGPDPGSARIDHLEDIA